MLGVLKNAVRGLEKTGELLGKGGEAMVGAVKGVQDYGATKGARHLARSPLGVLVKPGVQALSGQMPEQGVGETAQELEAAVANTPLFRGAELAQRKATGEELSPEEERELAYHYLDFAGFLGGIRAVGGDDYEKILRKRYTQKQIKEMDDIVDSFGKDADELARIMDDAPKFSDQADDLADLGDGFLFHGSNKPVTKFSNVKSGGRRYLGSGPAEFLGPSFSNSKEVAESFGKSVTKVRFSPQRPKVFKSLKSLNDDIFKTFGSPKPGTKVDLDDFYRDIADSYRVKLQSEGYDAIVFSEGLKGSPTKGIGKTVIPLEAEKTIGADNLEVLRDGKWVPLGQADELAVTQQMDFDLIKNKAQGIKDFVERNGGEVSSIQLAGSRLTGTAKPTSDLDFRIDFGKLPTKGPFKGIKNRIDLLNVVKNKFKSDNVHVFGFSLDPKAGLEILSDLK